MRRERRAIFKVGEVLDVDQRSDRLTVLTDRHRAMAALRLGDECGQVRLSRGQRIGHGFDRNAGRRHSRAMLSRNTQTVRGAEITPRSWEGWPWAQDGPYSPHRP